MKTFTNFKHVFLSFSFPRFELSLGSYLSQILINSKKNSIVSCGEAVGLYIYMDSICIYTNIIKSFRLNKELELSTLLRSDHITIGHLKSLPANVTMLMRVYLSTLFKNRPSIYVADSSAAAHHMLVTR